jgi:O-antigen ligase
VSAEPLELFGMLLACGAAAAAILAPGARWQPWALLLALIVAPVLVLGDVWAEPRVVDLRDSPALIAAGLAALAAAVGIGAALVRRWEWAFPVLVFAAIALRLPIRIGGETSNLLIPLYLVIASALAATIWGRWRGGDEVAAASEPPAVVWLRRALAATLVLYAIQSSYSDDVSNAIENACFFLVPFAVLFCQLAQVRWSRSTLTATTIAIGVVGVGVAAIGIAEYLIRDLILNKELLDSNQIKSVFRVNSLFHDPNVFGRYLALGVIALGAAVAWSRGGRAAMLATAAGVVMLAGLALSYSITSIAALLAGLAVLAVLRYGLRGVLGAGAAILLTGAVFWLSGGLERDDIGPTRGIDEETSGRAALLEGGVDLIEEEPILGWGSGAFGRAYFDHIRETETTASHSEPINVAAEQGIPGAALYLALLGTMLWVLLGAGVRSGAARAAAAAGVAALIVHSLGYASFLTDPATWALLAVAVGVRRTDADPEP